MASSVNFREKLYNLAILCCDFLDLILLALKLLTLFIAESTTLNSPLLFFKSKIAERILLRQKIVERGSVSSDTTKFIADWASTIGPTDLRYIPSVDNERSIPAQINVSNALSLFALPEVA